MTYSKRREHGKRLRRTPDEEEQKGICQNEGQERVVINKKWSSLRRRGFESQLWRVALRKKGVETEEQFRA